MVWCLVPYREIYFPLFIWNTPQNSLSDGEWRRGHNLYTKIYVAFKYIYMYIYSLTELEIKGVLFFSFSPPVTDCIWTSQILYFLFLVTPVFLDSWWVKKPVNHPRLSFLHFLGPRWLLSAIALTWFMDHIMDPSLTLLNTKIPPFRFRHQMCFRDQLGYVLGQHDMPEHSSIIPIIFFFLKPVSISTYFLGLLKAGTMAYPCTLAEHLKPINTP